MAAELLNTLARSDQCTMGPRRIPEPSTTLFAKILHRGFCGWSSPDRLWRETNSWSQEALRDRDVRSISTLRRHKPMSRSFRVTKCHQIRCIKLQSRHRLREAKTRVNCDEHVGCKAFKVFTPSPAESALKSTRIFRDEYHDFKQQANLQQRTVAQ